jgi:uncharacterized Zn-finger protein
MLNSAPVFYNLRNAIRTGIRILNTSQSVSSPDDQLANAESSYEVRRADLPLSCPMPSMALWNSHPRVYLPVEETGTAKCPYCGAVFVLAE